MVGVNVRIHTTLHQVSQSLQNNNWCIKSRYMRKLCDNWEPGDDSFRQMYPYKGDNDYLFF